MQSRTFYISGDGTLESHKELGKELAKLSDSMCDGITTYNGKPFLVWLVSGDHSMEQEILKLAQKFGQDAVLVVHGDNQDAELIYTTNVRKQLGTFVCLGPDEGKLLGRDYSYINGNFYVVE